MNNSQKDLIIALREGGLSYRDIAEKTGTSTGYCRVVCSQNKHNKKAEPRDTDLCKYCGQPLVHATGFKRKQFCSDKCRSDYHNRENLHKPYVRICEYCHNEFISYGYPKKRFCSRECQTLAFRKGKCHDF